MRDLSKYKEIILWGACEGGAQKGAEATFYSRHEK